MATEKQVKYVQSLQEQYYDSDMCEEDVLTYNEIRNMSNQEVSNRIDELKRGIAEDDLYNECMSNGLPNQ
ncbi:hypothetical protein ACFV8V_05445 [Mammaliicoccus sciuri]|uniref:hypothetical protein n=1 Tax=Mammaliicoccus sciuri TaxID=1296 RepID=UPI00364F2B08